MADQLLRFISALPHGQALTAALQQTAATLALALLSWAALLYFPPAAPLTLFNPAAGLGLALLLLGGRRYLLAVLAGTGLGHLAVGSPLAWALSAAAASTAALALGHALLASKRDFDPRLPTIRHLGWLLGHAIVPAATASSLLGVALLGAAGLLPAPRALEVLALEWMSDALGMVIGTPLVLLWRLQPLRLRAKRRWLEMAAAYAITLLLGQMVLLSAWPELLPALPRRAYWLFPPVVWVAARLGRRAVLTLLALIALQVMAGLRDNLGFFAQPSSLAQAVDAWGYLLALSLVGLYLACALRETRAANQSLRIAATAFECQEGMIILDAAQRIQRVNRSFTQITGYTEEEVQGQAMAFLHADPHPADAYEQAWQAARSQGRWAGEVWHRRKKGEIFPQWLTITAVSGEHGAITHYVLTHTDLSERKQREAQTQAQLQLQRNALVREVHHRIKNHLQGITGLLRQHAQAHPQLSEPLQQAIAQVRSVAIIHGLQAKSLTLQVRLCELTPLIAQEVGALWQVPVRLDIPADWTPCLIAEVEAVPLALVLSELVTNAIKHSQADEPGIAIHLRKGAREDQLFIRISNPGHWQKSSQPGHGLQLVQAMLLRGEAAGWVHTTLMLEPPVIALDTATHHHDNALSKPTDITSLDPAAAGR